MHRGDLHEALASCVPAELISLDKKLTDADWRGDGVTLRFADGFVGAGRRDDRRRRHPFARARDRRRRGSRPTSPAASPTAPPFRPRCCGGHSDRRVLQVVGPGPPHRDLLRHRQPRRVCTSSPACRSRNSRWNPGWRPATSSTLRAAFTGFHEQVRRVVEACPRVHKWAIVDRDPLPHWGEGRMVLLGDAGHPMTQYMAQGAATAMEDVVLLTPLHRSRAGRCPACVPPLRESAAGSAPRRIQGTSQKEHLDARGD